MTNEDVATFVVALFPPILFIVDLNPWIEAVGGLAALAWIGRQLYVSFVTRKEDHEEHKLKMAVLRKQLGKNDKDEPLPEA